MISIKSFLLCLMMTLVLRAQEGELTLDPNDIPLTPDPALQVPPAEITLPNLEAPPPSDPVPTPQLEVAPPVISPRVEDVKPTPSNLEVKSEKATAPSASSNANETDSSQKEERFNKTYTKFHQQSTSEQNWEKVVGKRTADTYIVNKGDTLWDISGTLFGDPFYWPKVWSLNKDLIYNPHVIFPDMKIKFFQGNSKAAPTLATDNLSAPNAEVKTEPEVAVKDTGGGTFENDKWDPSGPSNAKLASPLRKLPRFFRDNELRVKKQVDVQIEEPKQAATDTLVKLEFYVAENAIVPSGEIVEVENALKSAGDGQYVFVKIQGEPQGSYTVLKQAKTMKEDKDSSVVEIHEVQGEVKILGKVNTEENVYRAQVRKSATLVTEGAILVPGGMKTFKLVEGLRESTAAKGRIIGDLADYDIVGQGSFVLINQGTQAGYQAGMLLPIFEDLEKRNSKSVVKENPQKVGSVVIVEPTDHFSIGYITRIYDRVLVQDYVGAAEGGSFAPKTSSTAGEESLDGSIPTDAQAIDGPPSDAPPSDDGMSSEEF